MQRIQTIRIEVFSGIIFKDFRTSIACIRSIADRDTDSPCQRKFKCRNRETEIDIIYKEAERQRDREKERQRDKETARQREREAEGQRDRETKR